MHDQSSNEAKPGPIQRVRPHCYICVATENLTDDHIPPKGFFLPNNRENLITAPLCDDCHPRLTKMDEQMRAWIVAGAAATSNSAKWIWKKRVIDGTFKRSPKLRRYVAEKHLRQMTIETPQGPVVANVMTMSQGTVIPFIRRLAKGLVYTFHSDYDYFGDNFSVVYRLATPETVSATRDLATKLSRRSVGQDVFLVWHGLTQDSPKSGALILLFYEAVCFVCFHGKGDAFPQPDLEEGYAEAPAQPRPADHAFTCDMGGGGGGKVPPAHQCDYVSRGHARLFPRPGVMGWQAGDRPLRNNAGRECELSDL
jgi:hypothetical protein